MTSDDKDKPTTEESEEMLELEELVRAKDVKRRAEEQDEKS